MLGKSTLIVMTMCDDTFLILNGDKMACFQSRFDTICWLQNLCDELTYCPRRTDVFEINYQEKDFFTEKELFLLRKRNEEHGIMFTEEELNELNEINNNENFYKKVKENLKKA